MDCAPPLELNKCTPDDFVANQETYLKHLDNYSNWDQIPLLNHGSIYYPDKSLVRFRGMIQDMYNPEIYLENYEVIDAGGNKKILSGKYKDINSCADNEKFNHGSDKNINGERQTLFVISVPGLSNWVCDNEQANIKTNKTVATTVIPETSDLKRNLDDDESPISEDKCLSPPIADSLNKIKITTKDENETKTSLEYILNSPIPDKLNKACIVKIYDNFDSYKVNEIVDVIGFLSIDPALVTVGDENMCENQADNLPPSVVPRLHAICIKQIAHCNPLLDRTKAHFDEIPPQRLSNSFSAQPFVDAYKNLHKALTHTLFGDELAAEYTIFYLLSRVFARHDITLVGSYCLNITNLPSANKMKNIKLYLKHIFDLLSSLLPVSHSMSLTIDELNTAMFVPKKDYNTDRLVAGQLQLANGTNLFIEEISLEEGKLNQAGIMNLQALKSVIRDQLIKYDFQYYHVDFQCDIPVLVFSEGKSILDIKNQVPLEIDENIRDNFENILPAVKQFLSNETMDLIRCYLTIMKNSEFEVNQELHEIIENDFVNLLQEPGMTPEDLHSYLTLARLYSLSRGLRHLTKDSWQAVKDLETKRRSRIKAPKHTVEM